MDTKVNPHANAQILFKGPAPEQAKAVVILLHGRGASAGSMLSLFDELQLQNIAAIAPEAAGNTWYPYSFLSPRDQNEPFLGSALETVKKTVMDLQAKGIPSSRIALLGFSQGACLACEFVARNPQKYGALIAFTGGLIGPIGMDEVYEGDLSGTSVFLGSSDPDPHVPFPRIEQSAEVLRKLGANVEVKAYKGMPHTINEEELEIARQLISKI